MESPDSIVDVFASLYIIRFGVRDAAASLQAFAQELKLRFLLLWIRAMLKAVSLTDVHPEYVGRMAVHLGNSVALVGESIGLDVESLMAAAVYLYESKDGNGVVREGEKLELAVHEMFVASRAADGTEADQFVDRLYDVAILAVCGRIVNVYPNDLEALRDVCVARVLRTAGIAETTSQLDQSVNLLLGDILWRFTDKRYEPPFQYVFALWPLRKDSSQE
jgi:hypothetical protein